MSSDIVPDRLESRVNYWIILLIIGLATSFHFSLYLYQDEESSNQIISVVSFINPLFASMVSFLVAKRYSTSKTFGKAYALLGLGYLFATIAEILYLVYDLILGIEPYPSIADVFFFALYPCTFAHLLINIRFFRTKIGIDWVWMAAIPIGIVTAYTTLLFGQTDKIDFDFYYGIIFVAEPAVVLSFAIRGAKIFRGGTIGTAWLVLVFAISALTIGDVWYYYLEIFDQYDLRHPVNVFWYVGYWVVVYALYKHKESI